MDTFKEDHSSNEQFEKDLSHVRLRDPSEYALKDEREAEADFLAPA